MKTTQSVDAVTVEIIRNGLIAVTEEMKSNLTRTAYNLIIYEALDFTVGLFTVEGDSISIGLGRPMFIRGMSETVKAKIRHFGLENIEPGDHERFSHYVKKDKILASAVMGEPVVALCGKVWVPNRDPSRVPVCPTCEAIYKGLAPGGGDSED